MKDPKDKATVDPFPAPKKRGPAPSGYAMTAAERKAAQVKRAAAEVRAAVEGKKPFAEVTITALFNELRHAVRLGQPQLTRIIADELELRARFKNRENHLKGKRYRTGRKNNQS